jgi:hypothetical protein
MNIEIFLHKAEKWSEDDKLGKSMASFFQLGKRCLLAFFLESLRQVDGRIADRLADQAPDYDQQPPINIQITSIYDHTLLEAFSRVLHKLITSLPYLEELLNAFCAVSGHVSVDDYFLVCIRVSHAFGYCDPDSLPLDVVLLRASEREGVLPKYVFILV